MSEDGKTAVIWGREDRDMANKIAALERQLDDARKSFRCTLQSKDTEIKKLTWASKLQAAEISRLTAKVEELQRTIDLGLNYNVGKATALAAVTERVEKLPMAPVECIGLGTIPMVSLKEVLAILRESSKGGG
jgi:predicted RNase H-like nuclease (RuvC/YqgF family)